MENRTIAAVSTARAPGAIAVIRISGTEALSIADKVFRPASGEGISRRKGYTAAYGEIVSPKTGALLDEGVALVYRGPKSYTGEDMVELSCHGGTYLTARVLQAVVEAGALPAGPGEFTKQAFLNGKLDLSEAEAVAELIAASGEEGARQALLRRRGAVGKEIEAIGSLLTDAAAGLAAWADYPEEEDAPAVTSGELRESLAAASKRLKKIADQYHTGSIIQNGISAAIVGRPNVGKSTLLNLLVGSERSIVTEIPGTTRDVIQGDAQIEGVPIRFYDTAGLRDTGDKVEQIGVKRAREQLEQSDLVIAVFDASETLTEEDRALLKSLGGRPAVIVLNKSDLGFKQASEELGPCVAVSAKNGEGAGELRQTIAEQAGLHTAEDGCLIASQRQFDCVNRSLLALLRALEELEAGMTLDAVSVLVDEALEPLLELTGKRVSEAVLETVFQKFCVGK